MRAQIPKQIELCPRVTFTNVEGRFQEWKEIWNDQTHLWRSYLTWKARTPIERSVDPNLGCKYSPRCIKQDRDEFSALLSLLKDIDCKVVLEIGLHHGGTHFLFKEISDTVISIDIDFACVHTARDFLSFANRDTNSYFVFGSSMWQTTYDLIAARWPKIDCLFIDGNHVGEAPRIDHDMFEPLVRKGGVVAFHDFFYRTNIRKFVTELSLEKDVHCFSCEYGIAYYIK